MLRAVLILATLAIAFGAAAWRSDLAADATAKNNFINQHKAARTAAFSVGAHLAGGINGATLAWDPALATAMSNYLNNCVWGHDANRGNVGENIYASVPWSATPATYQTHLTNAFNSWAGEKSAFTNAKAANTFCVGVCGHYSQIVWRATTKIGCAYAGCATVANLLPSQGWVNPHVIGCRYSPPGNVQGQWAYQQTEADALAPGVLEINGQRFNHPHEQITQGNFNWSIIAAGVALVALVSIIAAVVVIRRRRVAAAAVVEEASVELLA